MILQYTESTPAAATAIRLVTADHIDKTYGETLATASAKTPGAIATDPQAAGALLLGIGEGSAKSAFHAGRKFVNGLAEGAESIAIDVSAIASTSERADSAPLLAFLRGLHVGTYRTDLWKGERPGEVLAEAVIYVTGGVSGQVERCIVEATAMARGQCAAMHLVDRPANAKRPMDVAAYVSDLGEKHGFEVELLDAEALEIRGFGGVLAVGRASAHPPCVLVLRYGAKSSGYHLGLVGKGITFDSGGISIKASKNMGFMKSDLGGAAAVLGTFVAVAESGLDVELSALLGVAENVIGGDAYLPSDVIRNYGGKTIEITDTDAEGRLVMADCLAYLPEIASPDFTIDVATLTGSAVQTFGYEAAAMFTHDDVVAEAFAKTGERFAERVWRLPLWESYEEHLRSDVADIKHFHGLPIAGAINAAKFLEYFAADKSRWMHLDIAPVAFAASEFAKDRAATGYGVTLLTEYLRTKTADVA